MAYAIMRWAKITSQVQAEKATGHNYRTDKVANADKEAPHPNVELVNTAGRGYWELAEERIAEVVTRKVRDDQVRCMEVILTASPEFFERDANGRAVDMKDSQWFKDQLTFLEKTFRKENVLSCTLHQDEKSPHVHAVIAPITEDGRLSAKLLFNPKTMTDYQSQYAEAMTVHGLVRGIEHSQAEHQDMKRMYGQQTQTAAELRTQLGPASSYRDEEVKRPSAKDYFDLNGWEAKTTAQVNEKARAQVEEANKRAEKAQNLALENAAAKDQVRVLQKQLSTSEALKEANYEKFKGERAKVDDLAMRAAGGEPASPEIIERGKQLLDQGVQDVQQSRDRVASWEKECDQAERKGNYGRVAELRYGLIRDEKDRQNDQEAYLRGYKGGAERLDKLDEEQAKKAEKMIPEEKRKEPVKQEPEQVNKTDNQQLLKELIQQENALYAANQARIQDLTLMDKAFKHYRWRVGPEDLTACLIVPNEKVEKVKDWLTVASLSYAANLNMPGEPSRKDGQVAVYVTYDSAFARQASQYFDLVRKGGGQVYEHTTHQTRREQLHAQPQQKAKEREQGPAPSQDMERD
jgi:Plasmid recombination enzyme